MVWDNMNVQRGHDEFYDVNDLYKAYEDGCRDGWRAAMEEAQRGGYGERGGYGQREMGYGQRDNYPSQGGYNPDAYGERRGVKGTGPYSRMR